MAWCCWGLPPIAGPGQDPRSTTIRSAVRGPTARRLWPVLPETRRVAVAIPILPRMVPQRCVGSGLQLNAAGRRRCRPVQWPSARPQGGDSYMSPLGADSNCGANANAAVNNMEDPSKTLDQSVANVVRSVKRGCSASPVGNACAAHRAESQAKTGTSGCSLKRGRNLWPGRRQLTQDLPGDVHVSQGPVGGQVETKEPRCP